MLACREGHFSDSLRFYGASSRMSIKPFEANLTARAIRTKTRFGNARPTEVQLSGNVTTPLSTLQSNSTRLPFGLTTM
jgi:hypothetical protein